MSTRHQYQEHSGDVAPGKSPGTSRRGGVPGKTPRTGALASAGAVQRRAGRRRSPVQARAAAGSDDADHVHRAASRGVAGSAGPLPHHEAIQRSFGGYDVSGVQAHVGGEAADACEDMGAEAYATGDRVAFRDTPDLHTAAHEAAHVVQQRSGVSLQSGVGRQGDGYERHADAVADRVVRGESAEPDLAEMAPDPGARSADAATQARPIQRYIGEEYVEGAMEGARDLASDVLDWGAGQIESVGQLLEYLGAASNELARDMLRQLSRIDAQLVANFVLQHPTHQLAVYAASQLPAEQLAEVAAGLATEAQDLVVEAIETCGEKARVFASLYQRHRAAAVQLIQEFETEQLPAILASCGELASDLFNEWWPSNTGFEGQVTLGAGASVPVWPEPPIFVTGNGQWQGEVKLYNKTTKDDGMPKLEFEVGSSTTQTAGASLRVPQGVSAGADQQLSLANRIKTITRFGEVDWNVGLLEALRGGDREGAFHALAEGVGNLVEASQFQITYKLSAGRGMNASAGAGDIAEAAVSAMMSLGLQVQLLTPNEQNAGKITAEGSLTVQAAGDLSAQIGGVPDNLSSVVSYLTSNMSAGGEVQGQVGARLEWTLPEASVAEPEAPDFKHAELFVGTQASARVARERLQVGSEGSIRFTKEELESFSVPDVSDGMTRDELVDALPFSQIGLKGSVALDSGLAGIALRRLVAGDNAALEFLTGQPSVGGKVEVEFGFEDGHIADFLVDLGVIQRDESSEPEGSARDALDAIAGADVQGFLAAVGGMAQDFGEFLWNSLDKVKVDLHADANYTVPGLESTTQDETTGQDETISGTAEGRLRAAYSNEYERADLVEGYQQIRSFLERALPPDVAGHLP